MTSDVHRRAVRTVLAVFPGSTVVFTNVPPVVRPVAEQFEMFVPPLEDVDVLWDRYLERTNAAETQD